MELAHSKVNLYNTIVTKRGIISKHRKHNHKDHTRKPSPARRPSLILRRATAGGKPAERGNRGSILTPHCAERHNTAPSPENPPHKWGSTDKGADIRTRPTGGGTPPSQHHTPRQPMPRAVRKLEASGYQASRSV